MRSFLEVRIPSKYEDQEEICKDSKADGNYALMSCLP